MSLVLASQSAIRRQMLEAAGVPFEAVDARVDEDSAKAALSHLPPRDLADALAEMKALKVSRSRPADLVLGCDSVGDLNGERLDKPGDQLAALLRKLRGQTHQLHSAAVVCLEGQPIWRAIESAKLRVRPLSDAFIADYVDRDPEAKECAGGYRVEGLGAQLFTRIDGSLFAVQGLPLLPLLDYLRRRDVIPS